MQGCFKLCIVMTRKRVKILIYRGYDQFNDFYWQRRSSPASPAGVRSHGTARRGMMCPKTIFHGGVTGHQTAVPCIVTSVVPDVDIEGNPHNAVFGRGLLHHPPHKLAWPAMSTQKSESASKPMMNSEQPNARWGEPRSHVCQTPGALLLVSTCGVLHGTIWVHLCGSILIQQDRFGVHLEKC